MPIFLKELGVVPEVAGQRSVLIVVCRLCPAASMAARYGQTYLEPLRRGLNTEVFERHVADAVSRLGRQGVKTSVFRGGLLNFMICMWSARQREEFRRRASAHEAVVVLGCRSAYEGVCRMVDSTGCRIVPGME